MIFATAAGEVVGRARLSLREFRGFGWVAVDPLPPDRGGERAGQDRVGVADRLGGADWVARVWSAACPRAVVARPRPDAPRLRRIGQALRTVDHCGAALADGYYRFGREGGEGLLQGRGPQTLSRREIAHRLEAAHRGPSAREPGWPGRGLDGARDPRRMLPKSARNAKTSSAGRAIVTVFWNVAIAASGVSCPAAAGRLLDRGRAARPRPGCCCASARTLRELSASRRPLPTPGSWPR